MNTYNLSLYMSKVTEGVSIASGLVKSLEVLHKFLSMTQ